MKKITLALLAVTCFIGSGFSQLNYNLVAPPDNGSTSPLRGPNGTAAHALQRGIMYIHPYEMLPMNSSSITSVGFQYLHGTGGVPVVGNFTLYMQNAPGWAYAKGQTYTGALTGMQTVYTGTYTVPGGTGPATVTLPFTSGFNFTGDGVYVAWDFSSAGPYAAAAATLQCTNNFAAYAELWLGSMEAAAAPITNTFTGSNFRPALIFNATNTNTNEIEVVDILAEGKIARQFNTPQNITSMVVNSSIGAQNNVTVALNATGANPFSTTQVINMAPGAITTLTWSNYIPTTDGQSTITIASLFSDQNLANNSKTWIQEVTCNEISQNKPVSTFTFNSSFGFGLTTGSGCFLSKHTIPTSASLTAVKLSIGASSTNTNQNVYGVLVSSTGAILATSSNTVSISPSTIATLNFGNVGLTAGSVYYIGVAQPTSGYYPIAYQSNNLTFDPPPYYDVPLTGGTITQAGVNGYFGMDAVFGFSSTAITASATKTLICKNAPPNSVTLTVTGPGVTSFSWSTGGTGTMIAVTPTAQGSGGTGPVFYYVVGTETLSGCKTGSASITVSISACTALESNTTSGYDLKVFPNPAVNGKSTITGLTGTNAIIVYNNLGQVILTRTESEESTFIDLSNQPAGNYLIRITNQEHESRTVKLVNQH